MDQSITIYTTRFCGFCFRAKRLLDSKKVEYIEISVDGDRQARAELAEKSGQTTVPQIWIGEKHIGGCDDLYQLDYSGRLDTMLENLA